MRRENSDIVMSTAMRDAHADGRWTASAIVARDDPTPSRCVGPKKKPRQENLSGLTAGNLHLPSGLANRELNVPAAWKQEIASVGSRLAAELQGRLGAGQEDRRPKITPEASPFQAQRCSVTPAFLSRPTGGKGLRCNELQHEHHPTNGTQKADGRQPACALVLPLGICKQGRIFHF